MPRMERSQSTKKNSQFSVLRRVGKEDFEVLAHTLYRYIVLFGLPMTNPSAARGIGAVWTLLQKHLRPSEVGGNESARPSLRRAAASARPTQKPAHEQFEHDQASYSLDRGRHETMQRARERLARVPGAVRLLRSLVAFNPTDRPTMKATLLHEVFTSMRVTADATDDLPRPAHYSIDCYAADKTRLPDV
jgi:serine/threonine protein kinase